jgi:DUF1126 PH-like domain
MKTDLPIAHHKPPVEYHPPDNASHLTESEKTLRSSKIADAIRFLNESEPIVLRYYAHWDDVHGSVKAIRRFELRAYLSDNTFEILELGQINSGRLFLRREHLPKEHKGMESLFNVCPVGTGSLASGDSSGFYTWKDLDIGKEINIFGRKFVIDDADGFTKGFIAK